MFGIEDFTQSIIDFGNFELSQLGDALLFGGAIMLIGMATVFAVLLVLWGCLALFKFFFHDLAKSSTKHQKKVIVAEAPPVAHNTSAGNDEEIVAVIAAAVAMAESESSGIKFRVVSFKRK